MFGDELFTVVKLCIYKSYVLKNLGAKSFLSNNILLDFGL